MSNNRGNTVSLAESTPCPQTPLMSWANSAIPCQILDAILWIYTRYTALRLDYPWIKPICRDSCLLRIMCSASPQLKPAASAVLAITLTGRCSACILQRGTIWTYVAKIIILRPTSSHRWAGPPQIIMRSNEWGSKARASC